MIIKREELRNKNSELETKLRELEMIKAENTKTKLQWLRGGYNS